MRVKAIAFGANLFQSRIEKALFQKVFFGHPPRSELQLGTFFLQKEI